ncbi:MAG TPA: CYTH and CHAD domain-containing protein [Gaiellaceae bacterium]|nr:CYTH and CHAD domain-containing protein [Gaiellaceae bacterium]
MEHSPERELKLAATPDFHMPSIYGLVGPIVRQAPPERNETTYYDTPDLRLARWGASLRHRPGEGWTVKLPAERDAPFLVRPEIVFDGNGDTPPPAAVELVRGFIRGGALQESVHMTTIRRRTEMHDAGGRLIAGVVDDAVSVPNGAGPAAAFRELEVEIGEDMTPDLLDALVERLRQAGAGSPDQTAKYIRALAPAAPLTPEIAVADLGTDATAGDVVGRAIALSVIRLIRHDAVVRLDVDPEGVHQARVATRRLRSDLRTFRPLVDEEWSTGLRDELGWIARILGDVRDGDVLLARLRQTAAELPEVGESADPVLASLQASRDVGHAALLDAFRSERYTSLLDRLVDAANTPVLAEDAGEPAAEAIPALVRRPWHRLSKRAKELGDAPTDAQLHEVRIRTKRARYAAEAAAPVVGKQARAFAHAAARLQDVLGDLNDTVVARAWLDGWTVRDDNAARAAETLAAFERSTAEELRGRWRAAWEDLADPKLRAWM